MIVFLPLFLIVPGINLMPAFAPIWSVIVSK